MTGEFLLGCVWLFYSITLSILVATGGYFMARCIYQIWTED